MDRPEDLFEQPVDRTPYGACAFVAVIVLAVFLIGAQLLWTAGSWVKRRDWSLSLPGFALPSASLPNAKDVGSQVQNTINNAASSAAKSAADAATQAAKDEAAKQAQAAQQSLQSTLQNNFK